MSLKSLKAELSTLQTGKRRPLEDVTRRFNELPYSISNVLYKVPLYTIGDSPNWMCISVKALDDETFRISTYAEELVFKDEDLKPDHEGKIIINIEPLRLETIYGGVELPQEFELPLEVLEPRKERRRLKALAKDAILVDHDCDPFMYYYASGDQVRILQGENEVTADIEIVYGKPAVNVEALDLGHPYLELPAEVACKFTKVIDAKQLENVSLLPVGKNLLNGKDYFRLSQSIPENLWHVVEHHFEFFEGNDENMQGWLTCDPSSVAATLGVSST